MDAAGSEVTMNWNGYRKTSSQHTAKNAIPAACSMKIKKTKLRPLDWNLKDQILLGSTAINNDLFCCIMKTEMERSEMGVDIL